MHRESHIKFSAFVRFYQKTKHRHHEFKRHVFSLKEEHVRVKFKVFNCHILHTYNY